jgi:hypothetical protein
MYVVERRAARYQTPKLYTKKVRLTGFVKLVSTCTETIFSNASITTTS